MDTPKPLLFVTKDTGGFWVMHPLANALRENGRQVLIIAEGKSLPLWQEAGWEPITLNGTRDGVRATALLKTMDPEGVFATLGSPINLEDTFSHAANQLKIPLVWFPDVWGAEIRSQAVPDVLLAFDDVERALIEADLRFSQTRIRVVGHPLASEMMAPPSEMATQVVSDLKLPDETVILIAGQGAYTMDMIEFVRKSIMYHSIGSFTIIPRFHPKYVKEEPQWVAAWNASLDEFPQGSVVRVDPSVKTDDLARLADITVSSFSTTLTYAALAGKIPISVATPAARAAMVKSTGLDHYPPTRVGAAIEAIAPISLSTRGLRIRLPAQEYFRLHPLNAQTMISSIWEEPWFNFC